MRIGIDARAYGPDWTGIGRYVRNLLLQVTTQSAHDRPTLAQAEFVVFIPPQYAHQVAKLPRTRVVLVRPSYYSLYEQTGLLGRFLSERTDLLHIPHFNVPLLLRRPFVVTIHDLTQFHLPGRAVRGTLHEMAYRQVFRSAIRRAKRILTVSEFTKIELLRRFPDLGEKVRVVYEGVDPIFLSFPVPRWLSDSHDASVLDRLGVPTSYILSVAVWRSHKNIARLIQAFRLCRDRGFTGALVLTGARRNPRDEDVRRLAEREGVGAAVITPGWVSDEELAALYRRASLFVVSSIIEGFGLPPLEAMASGAPVVATRAGSLPEILGDAAVYADPRDVWELADRILHVLSDSSLRDDLTARGKRRSAQFSWARCGKETLDVYEAVVEHPH